MLMTAISLGCSFLAEYRRPGTLLFILAVVCSPGAGAAESKIGGMFTLANTVGKVDSAPALAARGDLRELLVAWSDDADLSGEAAVYGQSLSSRGKRLGVPFPISLGAGSHPVASYNPASREYLVVYRRGPTENGGYEILGRRVDEQGHPLGTEFPILAGAGLGAPALAVDSANRRFLVAAGGEQGSRVRIMAADGTPLGPANVFGPAAAGPPALAFDSRGQGYLLAFEALSSDSGDVLGLAIDVEGRPAGPAFPVAAGAGRQAYPALAGTDSGFAVAWTDFGKTAPRLFLRRLDGRGSPAGRARLLSRSAVSSRLAASPDGRLLAAWARPSGQVMARPLSRKLLPEGPASVLSAHGHTSPSVVFLTPADALAVWAGPDRDGQTGIHGRRIGYRQSFTSDPVVTHLGVRLKIRRELKETFTDSDGKKKDSYTPRYSIAITNYDADTARLPTLHFVSTTGGESLEPLYPGCLPHQQAMVCQLGDLPAGKTVEIYFKDRIGTVCDGSQLSVRAQVTVTWRNPGFLVAPATAAATEELC